MSDEAKFVKEAALGILGGRIDSSDPWRPILEGGWIGIGVDEQHGGAGGTLVEAAAVAEAAGLTAAAAPALESMLAGLVVGACPGLQGLLGDLVAGRERAALVPRVVRSDHSGYVVDRELVVPWARHATVVLLVAALEEGGHGLVLVPMDEVTLSRGVTLAGDPLDRVLLPGAQLPGEIHELQVPLKGLIGGAALLTAARLVGALRATADLSVEYAKQRSQFGRTIGSFQAVSHALVSQAGHVALAEAGLRSATRASQTGDGAICDAARVLASSAVGPVSKVAHQVHGAVGVTREHDLHRFTLRLASWRDEFGSTRWWMRRVGTRSLDSGGWWDRLEPAAMPQ
jgi:acyl-CoA dehydrogenase